MLTVKWIVKTDKGEITRIFEAEDVAVAYRDNPLPPNNEDGSDFKVGRYPVRRAVLVINPHDLSSDRALDIGTCYVMNEGGKTVGSYQLYDGTFAIGTPLPMVPPPAMAA